MKKKFETKLFQTSFLLLYHKLLFCLRHSARSAGVFNKIGCGSAT